MTWHPIIIACCLKILVDPIWAWTSWGWWWLSCGQANCTGYCVSFQKVSQWCEAGVYLLASQAVDKYQSREGIDIALNDIETFLGTAKEYQLPSSKDFYNQYELMLTLDIKVIFLSYFDPWLGKGWGDIACCPRKFMLDVLSRLTSSWALKWPLRLLVYASWKTDPSWLDSNNFHYLTFISLQILMSISDISCSVLKAKDTVMSRNRCVYILHWTYSLCMGEADINKYQIQNTKMYCKLR